ncbi:anaerobic ribonucleoside-triphosphate reductase [Halorubrum pallidum]|uniref:Anaerobic ribonucleoside-triphosphate reductase n=1 Tax=Halorubrum pallidum TaxID=1526114 RepID=A0ABD5SXY8_9EURY|nr:anaerobic ribonucleoside-triphosphate reductase [Halorubrum sp. LN27]
MSDADNDPTPPDDLSEMLIQRIDALELPELKSLLSYIERRIESLRTSIEAEIEANTAGEVLEIENHGAYALVRKHPPDPDGSGVNTDITSLYHVRREHQLDGAESLHWAFLGDVHNTTEARCESCGRTFDREIDTCPNCGSDDVATETEE